MSINFKKILLAGTALVAVAAFSTQALAVNQDDNIDDASTTVLLAGQSASFTAPAAGTDEIFTVADTVAVGVGGAVVLATNADGVGRLNFLGSSAATGTIGAVANRLGLLTAGINAGSTTVAVSGNTFATTITNTGTNAAGTGTLNFGANVTATTFSVISAGAGAAAVNNSTVTGNFTATTTAVTGAANAGANASLTLNGATNAMGTATLTDGAAGTATLTFGGAAAQTVSGTIDGNAAGKGTLTITNTHASGTTFSGIIGGTQNLLAINAGVVGTTTTFNAATKAATLNVTSTGTVAFGANLFTGNIAFGGNNGTVTTSTGGITGNLDTSTASTGKLSVTGAAAVTGTIGATQSLAEINVANGATLTANGATIKATTTTLTGTGALSLNGAAHAVTTDIAAGDLLGTTTVNIADATFTTTFTGNMGTSTNKIGTLTVGTGAGGAAVLTTTGNLYVNAITAGAADTLQFLGTTAQTVSGTYNTGILTVGNGTTTSDVTFSGILGGGTALASGTVSLAAKATFAGNTSFAGAFVNNGTTTVTPTSAATKTLTTVGWTSGAASTLNLGFSNAAGNAVLASQTAGKLANTGAVTLTGSTLNFNVSATSAPLIAGTYANVITSNVGVTLPAAALITDNSYLYTFTPVVNGTNLDVVIASNIGTTTTTTGNTNAGNMLMTTLAASVDPQINLAQANLNAAVDAAAMNTVLEALQPDVNGSAATTSLEVGGHVQDINDTRMASLRSSDGVTGMAAGASSNGASLWFEGYGETASQGMRGGVDGYKADTFGGVVGADTTNIISGGILGASFNYGKTTSDSKNATTTATDIDNYGFNIFGSHDVGNRMFVAGQIGYAYNDITSTRHNVGGVPALTARGNTSSNQYSAKLALGRDYISSCVTITPVVSLAYTAVDTGGYTETGAGGLDLTVAANTVRALNLGLGAKVVWTEKQTDGSVLKPSLRATYAYDTIGDNISTSSTFAGGGTAFTSSGPSPDRNTFTGGAGLTYITTANWDLSANYDYTYKSNYDAHSGVIRLTTHF